MPQPAHPSLLAPLARWTADVEYNRSSGEDSSLPVLLKPAGEIHILEPRKEHLIEQPMSLQGFRAIQRRCPATSEDRHDVSTSRHLLKLGAGAPMKHVNRSTSRQQPHTCRVEHVVVACRDQ